MAPSSRRSAPRRGRLVTLPRTVLAASAIVAALAVLAPSPPARADAPSGASGTAELAGAAPAAAPALRPRPNNVVVEHEPLDPNPTFGPRHAPVTIDFFLDLDSDPTRGENAKAYRSLRDLASRHPLRLRVVIRLFAQEGRDCLAQSALEMYAQDRMEPFLDAVFSSSRMPVCGTSDPNNRDAMDLAARSGGDPAQVRQAVDESRHLPVIQANIAFYERRFVDRKPALLFNGTLLDRSADVELDRLEEEYDEAYQRAMALVADGLPISRVYPAMLRAVDLAREPAMVEPGDITSAANDDDDDDEPPPDLPPMGALLRKIPDVVHTTGPDDAPVTVAMFCSFRSVDCARMHSSLQTLREGYPGQIRVVFHHLVTARDDARRAARLFHMASLCADEQGAFWRFFDRVYDDFFRRERDDATVVRIIDETATGIGLDIDRFDACMDAPGLERRVEGLFRASIKAGVTHVPALVIGGRLYTGTKKSAELRQLVAEQLLPGVLEQWFPTW